MRPFPLWVPEKWFGKIRLEDAPAGLDDPCWIWLGARNRDGYSVIRDAETRKTVYLHRWAWGKYYGAPIGKDHDGHHRCERRPCFQPTHIERQLSAINRANTSAIKFQTYIAPADLAALADPYWAMQFTHR